MELITTLSQIVIAASILIVWVFRFDNIVIEFNHFGLPDLLRSVVGAAKIAMATPKKNLGYFLINPKPSVI